VRHLGRGLHDHPAALVADDRGDERSVHLELLHRQVAEVGERREAPSSSRKTAMARYAARHRTSPGAGNLTVVTVWLALTVADPAAQSVTPTARNTSDSLFVGR
jgi:hypothetical protein